MNDDDFNELTESIKQAGDIKKGRLKKYNRVKLGLPDVKAIREKLKVSQDEFSLMIGVSARTLQNWEQGRREPDGPAKALLRVASKNPQAVMEALYA